MSKSEEMETASHQGSTLDGHRNPTILPNDLNAPTAVIDAWEIDPDNACNWPLRQKWLATALVSLYSLIPGLASSMMAPSLPDIEEHFNITDSTVGALTLSIYLLSYAFAPLLLAPLSEMYGRSWVLHIGNIFTIAFSFGCAYSPTVGSLIGFRFLGGLSGSTPIACGGGSIGDMFSPRDRAGAMVLYTIGPLIGPVIGPIAGGFIAQTIGFKYVFVVLGAASALFSAIAIPLLRETYAPVIRERRAKHRRGDAEEKGELEEPLNNTKTLAYLWLNLKRPFILLTHNFVCIILSIYMAFNFGTYFLMFTTFPTLFSETYHFSTGIGGLVYLGLGTGFILASIFGARTADRIYKYLSDSRNGGVGKPEYRIPALFVGSLFIPAGLFWYGWSAQAKIHWIMPIIGSGIFGFGLMTTLLPIQLYLVDAFPYAASALSAASVLRSLFGFAFPLFAGKMFSALGTGGGNSLLGGLAIALGIPFPLWIYFYGERMRLKGSRHDKPELLGPTS